MFFWVRIAYTLIIAVVKYEARLEDGTVVSKSEGVEFTVKDGNPLYLCYVFTWPAEDVYVYRLFSN